jgi:hypothetical protein
MANVCCEDDLLIDTSVPQPGQNRWVGDQVGQEQPAEMFVADDLLAFFFDHILEPVVGLAPVVRGGGHTKVMAEPAEISIEETEESEPGLGELCRTFHPEQGINCTQHTGSMANESNLGPKAGLLPRP